MNLTTSTQSKYRKREHSHSVPTVDVAPAGKPSLPSHEQSSEHPICLAVQGWIAENPRARSIATLSRRTGVNAQKLRRMVVGESELTFAVASKIAATILAPQEAYDLISRNWPEEAAALELIITKYHGARANISVCKNVVPSAASMQIFGLAARICGVSSDEVKNLFGRPGLDVLGEMTEAGILRQESKRSHYFAISWPMTKASDILSGARGILDIYSAQNTNSQTESPLHVRFASMSAKHLTLITDLQRQYLYQIDEILQIDTSEDHVPVYISLCLTQLHENQVHDCDNHPK